MSTSTAALGKKEARRLSRSLVIQVGVLLASVGLVFVQVGRHSLGPGRRVPRPDGPEARAGEVVSREKAGGGPIKTPAVNDPERVKSMLPEGSTYAILVKGGYQGAIEGASPAGKPRSLAYAFELETTRTIESNDGRRIVEVRRFGSRKMVKLVTDAETAALDLGPAGMPILGSIPDVAADEGSVELPAEVVAEAILAGDRAVAVGGATSSAFVRADSLSGKQVRITYVDGAGVESVVPIRCSLTGPELKGLVQTPVLADCYLLPDDGVRGRRPWRVDEGELLAVVDPAVPAVFRGKLELESEPLLAGQKESGRQAVTRLEDGEIDYVSTVASYGRVGIYMPMGEFRSSADGNRVQTASLEGLCRVTGVSQNYFLFDEILVNAPTLRVSYSSTAVPVPNKAKGGG
jgi:hypothetical protein